MVVDLILYALLSVVGGFAAVVLLYLAVFFATFAYYRAKRLASSASGRNSPHRGHKESEHGEG